MGNRGDLHAEDGSLGSDLWAHKAWIACALDRKGRRVSFDEPGRYYPLFFHDEAVALAAGHRPCGQCRPGDLERFKMAWKRAYDISSEHFIGVREIDAILHKARTRSAPLTLFNSVSDFPDGTFVELSAEVRTAAMVWRGELRVWYHTGYTGDFSDAGLTVKRVITPIPMINVLKSGYEIRPSL